MRATLGILMVAAALSAPASTGTLTVDEIVARHVEARGGADKLRGLKSSWPSTTSVRRSRLSCCLSCSTRSVERSVQTEGRAARRAMASASTSSEKSSSPTAERST